jgi:putative MATE family efflux protein
MVLEMCMESLFGVVDVFWVSRLGADAVATVGLTETALVLVFVIAMGLSIGATALVARRMGEKDEQAAGLVAVQAIIIGLVVSATVAIFGYFFAPNLLHIMGGSASVVKLGSGYTRMIFSGSATIFLLFLINAVFRGAGDATIAMRVLWLANIVNICLNPCLIFSVHFHAWALPARPWAQLSDAASAFCCNCGCSHQAADGWRFARRNCAWIFSSCGVSSACR